MRLTRRDILKAGLLLPATWACGWPIRSFASSTVLAAETSQLDGEDVVFAHISDAHMRQSDAQGIIHLKTLLARVKAINPAFLLDTGDIADDNTGTSMENYLKAVDEVGGFSRYPDYVAGIPFVPVAGNHEFCGVVPGSPFPEYMGPTPPYVEPSAPTRHSFVVGNYRFVGTSSNPDWLETWPQQWLENQMALSCADGKPLILFHHHSPHGWMGDATELDITADGWAKIDTLAQEYPVLAYLCGHCHYDRLEAMPPGYVAHSNGRAVLRGSSGAATGPGALTLCALADGHINMNTSPGAYVFVVITRPGQYMKTQYHSEPVKALDCTKTAAASSTVVRAFARASGGGSIIQVSYSLDGGSAVAMRQIGSTPYWEATLDASGLSGEHTLAVTAKGNIGGWKPESTHAITCYLAGTVPARTSSACGSVNISLSLVEGWNLISVPFVPSSTALVDALSSIAGEYSEVFAYDAFDDQEPWKRHTPSAPDLLNNLNTMVPQRGYWLRMSAPATLYLAGEPLNPVSIPLRAGWNLVGYPSQTLRSVSDALASIAGQYDCVYAYDNSTPSGCWKTYNANAAPATNDLTEMVAGAGYWIHATADCTWTLS